MELSSASKAFQQELKEAAESESLTVDLQKAERDFAEAEQKNDDSLMTATCKRLIQKVYYYLNESSHTQYLQQALLILTFLDQKLPEEIQMRNCQKLMRAYTLITYALYHKQNKQLSEALKVLENAKRILDGAQENSYYMALCFLNLGTIYSLLNDRNTALSMHKKAVIKFHALYSEQVLRREYDDEFNTQQDFLDIATNLAMAFYNIGIEEENRLNYARAHMNYENALITITDNVGDDSPLKAVFETSINALATKMGSKNIKLVQQNAYTIRLNNKNLYFVSNETIQKRPKSSVNVQRLSTEELKRAYEQQPITQNHNSQQIFKNSSKNLHISDNSNQRNVKFKINPNTVTNYSTNENTLTESKQNSKIQQKDSYNRPVLTQEDFLTTQKKKFQKEQIQKVILERREERLRNIQTTYGQQLPTASLSSSSSFFPMHTLAMTTSTHSRQKSGAIAVNFASPTGQRLLNADLSKMQSSQQLRESPKRNQLYENSVASKVQKRYLKSKEMVQTMLLVDSGSKKQRTNESDQVLKKLREFRDVVLRVEGGDFTTAGNNTNKNQQYLTGDLQIWLEIEKNELQFRFLENTHKQNAAPYQMKIYLSEITKYWGVKDYNLNETFLKTVDLLYQQIKHTLYLSQNLRQITSNIQKQAVLLFTEEYVEGVASIMIRVTANSFKVFANFTLMKNNNSNTQSVQREDSYANSQQKQFKDVQHLQNSRPFLADPEPEYQPGQRLETDFQAIFEDMQVVAPVEENQISNSVLQKTQHPIKTVRFVDAREDELQSLQFQ